MWIQHDSKDLFLHILLTMHTHLSYVESIFKIDDSVHIEKSLSKSEAVKWS